MKIRGFKMTIVAEILRDRQEKINIEVNKKLIEDEKIREAHDYRIRKLEEHMNKCYAKIYACEVNLNKLIASEVVKEKVNNDSDKIIWSDSVYLQTKDLKFLCDAINAKQKKIDDLEDKLKQAEHKLSILEADNVYLQSQRLTPQGCKL